MARTFLQSTRANFYQRQFNNFIKLFYLIEHIIYWCSEALKISKNPNHLILVFIAFHFVKLFNCTANFIMHVSIKLLLINQWGGEMCAKVSRGIYLNNLLIRKSLFCNICENKCLVSILLQLQHTTQWFLNRQRSTDKAANWKFIRFMWFENITFIYKAFQVWAWPLLDKRSTSKK